MKRTVYQKMGKMLRDARKDIPRFGETKLQEAYDEISADINESRSNDWSLRQLFEHTVEDGYELVRTFDPRVDNEMRLMEAGGTSQAVSTGDFSNITGQIFFTDSMREFQNPQFIHGRLMDDRPTNLSGEKIPGIASLGDDSEVVDEGKSYPRVKLGEEYIETPVTLKRGCVLEVTKEAIFFDKTGDLLEKARQVGRTIGFSKEKRCLDLALGITNSYKYRGTSIDTYGDNSGNHDWDNLAASNTLVDWTDIETAELLFDAMTDPINGEPIMLSARQLVCPTALKRTAMRILDATGIRYGDGASNTTAASGPNPLGMEDYEIVSNAYVKARTSSATTWFFGDFKRAFCYMQNWPYTLAQLGANSHMDFDRDVVTAFKVSERGVPAVKEPRFVVKCT